MSGLATDPVGGELEPRDRFKLQTDSPLSTEYMTYESVCSSVESGVRLRAREREWGGLELGLLLGEVVMRDLLWDTFIYIILFEYLEF